MSISLSQAPSLTPKDPTHSTNAVYPYLQPSQLCASQFTYTTIPHIHSTDSPSFNANYHSFSHKPAFINSHTSSTSVHQFCSNSPLPSTLSRHISSTPSDSPISISQSQLLTITCCNTPNYPTNIKTFCASNNPSQVLKSEPRIKPQTVINQGSPSRNSIAVNDFPNSSEQTYLAVEGASKSGFSAIDLCLGNKPSMKSQPSQFVDAVENPINAPHFDSQFSLHHADAGDLSNTPHVSTTPTKHTEANPLERASSVVLSSPLMQTPAELQRQSQDCELLTSTKASVSSPTPHLLAAVAAAAKEMPNELSPQKPTDSFQNQPHAIHMEAKPETLMHHPVSHSGELNSPSSEQRTTQQQSPYIPDALAKSGSIPLTIPPPTANGSSQSSVAHPDRHQRFNAYNGANIQIQEQDTQYPIQKPLPASDYFSVQTNGNVPHWNSEYYRSDAHNRHTEYVNERFVENLENAPSSSHTPLYNPQHHSLLRSQPQYLIPTPHYSSAMHQPLETLNSGFDTHPLKKHRLSDKEDFHIPCVSQFVSTTSGSNPSLHPEACVAFTQEKGREYLGTIPTAENISQVLLSSDQEHNQDQNTGPYFDSTIGEQPHIIQWPPPTAATAGNASSLQFGADENDRQVYDRQESRMTHPTGYLEMPPNDNSLQYYSNRYHRPELSGINMSLGQIPAEETGKTIPQLESHQLLPWSSSQGHVNTRSGYSGQTLGVPQTSVNSSFMPHPAQTDMIGSGTLEPSGFFDVGISNVSNIRHVGVESASLSERNFEVDVDGLGILEEAASLRKRQQDNGDAPKTRKRRRTNGRYTGTKNPERATVIVHSAVTLGTEGTPETPTTTGSSLPLTMNGETAGADFLSSQAFACSGCGKEFGSKRERDNHVRSVHERMYSCSTCSARFKTRSDANRHVRIVHEQCRPYPCGLCPRRFSEKNKLKRHQETVHDKLRPYVCPVCHRTFGELGNLRQHTGSLHPDVPLDTAQLRTRINNPSGAQQIRS